MNVSSIFKSSWSKTFFLHAYQASGKVTDLKELERYALRSLKATLSFPKRVAVSIISLVSSYFTKCAKEALSAWKFDAKVRAIRVSLPGSRSAAEQHIYAWQQYASPLKHLTALKRKEEVANLLESFSVSYRDAFPAQF